MMDVGALKKAARSGARAAEPAQRALMYIVISKPKRRSWYWGVVHCMVSLLLSWQTPSMSGECSTARDVPMR
jgi:hypothetical protein